jgi:hypothetical protein
MKFAYTFEIASYSSIAHTCDTATVNVFVFDDYISIIMV